MGFLCWSRSSCARGDHDRALATPPTLNNEHVDQYQILAGGQGTQQIEDIQSTALVLSGHVPLSCPQDIRHDDIKNFQHRV